MFTGVCPSTGEPLSLARTRLAEHLARSLLPSLCQDEGKMYGVLLVRTDRGEIGYLKAFSGRLQGRFHHSGWVPPMIELEPTELEIFTKGRLEEMKSELKALVSTPLYQEREPLRSRWGREEADLAKELRERKALRAERRAQGVCENILTEESRADSRRRREWKASRKEALTPLEELESRIASLKSERRELSRTLQSELHQRFEGAVWSGMAWSLASLFPSGPPTGIGECCAPKLLFYARQNGLEPLSLAEIWWGEETEERKRGAFYPPCVERCQPLLGPLLSKARFELEKLYEDEHLLAVNKPSGLLTVPGRHAWSQDCLLNRLKSEGVLPVHRLDLETSGVVLFARSQPTQGQLQRAFAERQVEKVYQAILEGCPAENRGRLCGAISAEGNGRYRVDPKGQEAVTEYRVLDEADARLELRPQTGRSHQLRVHCAQELGLPIVGDPLYGSASGATRLLLHAGELKLKHPVTNEALTLRAQVPF